MKIKKTIDKCWLDTGKENKSKYYYIFALEKIKGKKRKPFDSTLTAKNLENPPLPTGYRLKKIKPMIKINTGKSE